MNTALRANNNIAAEPLPWWLRRPAAIVLVLFLAVGSHSWMVDLEFQLDDWEQIADAMAPSRDAVLLGNDSLSQRTKRGRPTFVAFFRPALFASMWIDVQLFGSDPRGHHASSVFYHAICALLFYLALLRILPHVMTATPRRSLAFMAWCAALVFAAHPGSWGAVSWVAARGDVLATMAFLLAATALFEHRHRPRWWKLGGVFFFLLLALLAKEGAMICGPILAVIDFLVLRKRSKVMKPAPTIIVDLLLIAIAPAYMYFRVWMFGPLANLYAGHVRVINREIIERMIEDYMSLLPRIFGGYFYTRDLETGDLKPLGFVQYVYLGVSSGLLALWLTRKPVRRTVGVLFLLGLFSVSIAPAVRFYREASGFDSSRLFYLPMVFTALLIAVPMQLLLARLKTIRLAAWAWLAFSLVVWGMGGYQNYASQKKAAAIIARVRQDVRAYKQTGEADDTAYVIFKLPTEVGNVALYGTFLRFAFTENFSDDPMLVHATWSEDLKYELRFGGLHHHKVPIRFLEWRSDDRDIGHLHAMTDVLPGLTGYHPELAWPADTRILRLDRKIHPRDVETLQVNFTEKPTKPFSFKLIFRDGKSEHTETVTWKPKHFGAAPSVRFHFLEESGWLFMGEVESVELVPLEGEVPTLKSLDFGASMPIIETLIADDTRFSIRGEEPEIRFKETKKYPWYRIRVFFGTDEQKWTFPRQMLPKYENGEIGIRLSKGGYFPDEHAISWDDLTKESSTILDLQGLTELIFRYKIEGLCGQIDANAKPQTTSKVATFYIVN